MLDQSPHHGNHDKRSEGQPNISPGHLIGDTPSPISMELEGGSEGGSEGGPTAPPT